MLFVSFNNLFLPFVYIILSVLLVLCISYEINLLADLEQEYVL